MRLSGPRLAICWHNSVGLAQGLRPGLRHFSPRGRKMGGTGLEPVTPSLSSRGNRPVASRSVLFKRVRPDEQDGTTRPCPESGNDGNDAPRNAARGACQERSGFVRGDLRGRGAAYLRFRWRACSLDSDLPATFSPSDEPLFRRASAAGARRQSGATACPYASWTRRPWSEDTRPRLNWTAGK